MLVVNDGCGGGGGNGGGELSGSGGGGGGGRGANIRGAESGCTLFMRPVDRAVTRRMFTRVSFPCGIFLFMCADATNAT